jgi:hypothetical protein
MALVALGPVCSRGLVNMGAHPRTETPCSVHGGQGVPFKFSNGAKPATSPPNLNGMEHAKN